MVNEQKKWLGRFFDLMQGKTPFPEKSTEPAPVVHQLVVTNQAPIGSYGTESYAGYISEDYLQAMRGTERADLFDKMRRSDTQISGLIGALTAPILSANWEIEAAIEERYPDRTSAEGDALLMKEILFHGMEETWNQKVQEILTMMFFGHSVLEIIDQPVMNHPRFGSYSGIRDLAFRSQRTIERWNVDKVTGKLLSVSQYAYGDTGRVVDIPAEFLTVFTLRREGGNYEGISMLRSCYGNWLRKNTYLKLNAIGIEKFAIPTPVATVPEGKEKSEEYTNMVNALSRYMAHERGYLIKPAGWELELNTNTYDPEKVEVSVDNEDKRMSKSVLANFLELGMNGFGSQSLSFDLSDFFLNSLNYVATSICENMDKRVLQRQIIMNRGPRPAYPNMKATGINDRLGQEFATIIKSWVDAGILNADDVLEAHLRKRFGLPAHDPTTKREKKAPPPMAGQPGGMKPSPELMERVARARKLSRG